MNADTSKRSLLAIATLFSVGAAAVAAQNPASPGSISTWVRNYGVPVIYDAQVQELGNGGFLLSGARGRQGAGWHTWFVRLNAQGHVIWQHQSAEFGTTARLEKTSDGGCVAVNVGGGFNPFYTGVWKRDADGNVQWRRTYSVSGNTFDVMDIKQTRNGGYVLTGVPLVAGAGVGILKLDSEGSAAWGKHLTGTGRQEFAVTETADSGYLGAGIIYSDGRYVSVSLKFSPSGEVLWQRRYDGGGLGSSFPGQILDIASTTDGGAVAAGQVPYGGAAPTRGWVVKLRTDGTIEWQREFANESNGFPHGGRFNGITICSDGTFIVGGSTGGEFQQDETWILHLDGTGAVINARSFNCLLYEEHAGRPQPTRDGGFIATTRFSTRWEGTPTVLKLARDLSVSSSCPAAIGRVTSVSVRDTIAASSVIAMPMTDFTLLVSNVPVSVVMTSEPEQTICDNSTDVALYGGVVDVAGVPVADATVSVSLLELPLATVQSAADGHYEFPRLPPGVYVLKAAKETFAADMRAVSLNSDAARQDFRLVPLPEPPQLQEVTDEPPFASPQPCDLEGAKLRVFDGTLFTDDLGLLNREKMTIVLTHGWICTARAFCSTETPAGIDGWPTEMAKALKGKGYDTVANIVAWDWRRAAEGGFPPHQNTACQGLGLGQALTTLGAGYSKPLHFMGHSLGTLVNAQAINYLYGDKTAKQEVSPNPWPPERAPVHVTLFDEAEIARLKDKDVLIAGGLVFVVPTGLQTIMLDTAIAVTTAGWITPIPKHHAWIDNYVSWVGLSHDEAVTICLQKSRALLWPDYVAMHGYGYNLYKRSVPIPDDSELFSRRSFETQALLPGVSGEFPPSEPELNAPSFYRQSTASDDELKLEKTTAQVCFVSQFLQVAEYVVDTAESGVRKAGNVVVDMGQQVAIDFANGVHWLAQGVDRIRTLDFMNRPGLRVRLRTGSPAMIQAPEFRPAADGRNPINVPAYAWFDVSVPRDAVLMAFDCVVTGEGMDDVLGFGINGTNLFSLGIKFIPEGDMHRVALVDVSPHAGATNEFFFGILGRTSTNCSVEISNIRFFTFTLPALGIYQTNDLVVISWPSSLNGYELESAPRLDAIAWSGVTNAPALFGGRFMLTTDSVSDSCFFRLRYRP